jgi:hypothetical protein
MVDLDKIKSEKVQCSDDYPKQSQCQIVNLKRKRTIGSPRLYLSKRPVCLEIGHKIALDMIFHKIESWLFLF